MLRAFQVVQRLPFSYILPSGREDHIKKRRSFGIVVGSCFQFVLRSFFIIIISIINMQEMGCAFMASPAFVVSLSFFLLSHLALHSSTTPAGCGLSTIYCENEKTMINSTLGKPYEVKSINEVDNTIVIHSIL